MTKTQELLELAERLEQATGPDRNLDADIMNALGYGGLQADYNPVAYSASLDAAMTLVPEDYDWIIGCTNGGLTIHAEVGGRGDEFQRFGNTPALALAAASLRARSQS